MAWTPITQRPEELRLALQQWHSKTNGNNGASFEDVYNSQELGLLSDEELRQRIKILTQTEAKIANENASTALSASRAAALQEETTMPRLRDGTAFEVKSLRYLRNSADCAEDRRWAETLHDSMLLELWLQHVTETGDTYYPPMADDLAQHYELLEDEL